MKITIITTFLIAFISILGMFYWMWKAKSGELLLNSNSWHIKLKAWMWDYEITGRENACPYYWGLVFSIIIFPVYFILKYLYLFFKNLDIILKKIWNKLFGNIKKPNIHINIPLPKFSETKKEMYSKIYSNAKNWLFWGFIGIILIILFISIVILIISFYGINNNLGTITLIITIITGLIFLQHNFKEKWDEYCYDYLINLKDAVFGLISLPFIIIYYIFAYPIRKIFKIYEDNCPPIKWIK
jgi:hypothetical protein